MSRAFSRSPRPATNPRKQGKILSELHDLIAREVWRSGDRLPTRRELETRFNTSSLTIQRTLNRLSAGGFIETRSRQGTFVAARPPNVSRYGLVFPYRPVPGQPLSRFWQAMFMSAPTVADALGVNIRVFYDVTHRGDIEGDYAQLLRAVQERQVAGLIFASSPHPLVGSPVLTTPGLPRIGFAGPSIAGVESVGYSTPTMHERALDYLQQRGRKRVAVITFGGYEINETFPKEAARRGITVRPEWIQSVFGAETAWVRNIIQLLMRGKADERPDALIVTDDHLVEDAQAGLFATGLRLPEDVELIGWANFPHPPTRIAPVTLMGIDVREYLAQCVHYIVAQRRGHKDYKPKPLGIYFEHELATAYPATLQPPAGIASMVPGVPSN